VQKRCAVVLALLQGSNPVPSIFASAFRLRKSEHSNTIEIDGWINRVKVKARKKESRQSSGIGGRSWQ
jgi:hypothetical protein